MLLEDAKAEERLDRDAGILIAGERVGARLMTLYLADLLQDPTTVPLTILRLHGILNSDEALDDLVGDLAARYYPEIEDDDE